MPSRASKPHRVIAPELIIELDERSRTRKDRKTRNHFVNNALKAAGLKLLRIPTAAR